MDRPERFASSSSSICREASQHALWAALVSVCVIASTVSVPTAAAPDRASAANSEQGVVVRQESARPSPEFTIAGEPPPGQIAADAIALGSFNPGPLVKDAPYAAEATTEVIQTFADGNRIVRRTSALLYRDSRGRTRREVALGDVAGIVVAGNPLRIITIHDPDTKTTYVFDPDNRLMQVGSAARGGLPPPADIQQQVTPPVDSAEREESLGTRTIEGLLCEGTRKTTTIPAGAIGNERPITTVAERWYSPELQLLILSRVSDPRFGETTYRVTKITRAEPFESLFETPQATRPSR
jgi:hypothetical protein